MPAGRRCLAGLLAAAALTLSSCTVVVDGHLGAHPAADAHLPVKGVTDSSFDTFAQNALSDIQAFWAKSYPSVSGGKALVPLKGGYYSVDGHAVAISGHASPPATDNACIRASNEAIVDNAFYCRDDDSIAWDRSPTHLLGRLATRYGSLLVGLIFAHEFGHSISNRLGIFAAHPPTIDTESQADCAAGAWAASVLKGQDPHFVGVTANDIDQALEGYLDSRDNTPIDAQDISHGNGFDRLSAIADGLQKGVTYCFSAGYFASRHFTERGYSDATDQADQGNLPFSQTIDTSAKNGQIKDLNRFWTAAAKLSSGAKAFAPVSIAEAAKPPCAASGVKFGYCPDTNTVYFDTAFARQAYYSLPGLTADKATGDVTLVADQPADNAVGELFAIAWGLAARHQLFGRSLDDAPALTSAICYSGAYSKNINVPAGYEGHDFTLSPSDLDEAVSALLDQVGKPAAFGSRGTTGLQRIQAFVKGYTGGLSVC